MKRTTPQERKFVVIHQQKQRLVLRALEQMDTTGETPEESTAVTEMIVRLEELIARRQRRRYIGETVPERRRRLRASSREKQAAQGKRTRIAHCN